MNNKYLSLFTFACLSLLLAGCGKLEWDASVKGALSLVENGRAVSAIVLPENPSAELQDAAKDFVRTVARSTGAEISIVTEDKETALAAETIRIFIGSCEKTLAAGLSLDELNAETWRMSVRDGNLFILGNDAASSGLSFPTRWALNDLLETGLGVRWLWPGELGTHIPRKDSFSVPETDRTHQSKLIWRSLAITLTNKSIQLNDNERKARDEALLWAANHQVGRRDGLQFGHAFGHWWEKYSKTHPDYFAESLPGVEQPFPKPDRVKLRLSNPAVIEQIAKEYEAAGAPKYYSVCPNDGGGFDLSAETRAWDIPANQNQEDIWRANANLTARYIKFWNLLYERLRQVNPDVVLASYAYSAYRYPPPAERPLTARMALGIVDKYTDSAYTTWQAWANTGAEMVLRPNWWHVGAGAPHLPLEQMSDFLHFAWKNGMIGIHMDSILGHWATQGLNYYLVARLMNYPELTREQIIDEYVSAFGKGAPKIREYIAYWENETHLNGFPAPVATAHGAGSINPDGRYEQLVREGKRHLSMNPISGSYQVLPQLYSDERLAPALRLLDEAERLIADSDAEARARVAFLRDGLEAVKATRDMVAASQRYLDHPTPETLKIFRTITKKTEAFRATLTSRHVLWGEASARYEDRFRLPINPRNLKIPEFNDDGML